MLSMPDTLWVLLAGFDYGLKHSLRIHGFWPTWPCLIVEVLATLAKFLELSGHCTVINCAFTFFTNVFRYFLGAVRQFQLVKSVPKLDYISCSYVLLSSHSKWSNTQCVSVPTTTVLQTTADTILHFKLLWPHDICTTSSMYQDNVNFFSLRSASIVLINYKILIWILVCLWVQNIGPTIMLESWKWRQIGQLVWFLCLVAHQSLWVT